MDWSEPSRARTGKAVYGSNEYADKSDRKKGKIPGGGWAMCGSINYAKNVHPSLMIRWQDGPFET